jgi:hypothetical protein
VLFFTGHGSPGKEAGFASSRPPLFQALVWTVFFFLNVLLCIVHYGLYFTLTVDWVSLGLAGGL